MSLYIFSADDMIGRSFPNCHQVYPVNEKKREVMTPISPVFSLIGISTLDTMRYEVSTDFGRKTIDVTEFRYDDDLCLIALEDGLLKLIEEGIIPGNAIFRIH